LIVLTSIAGRSVIVTGASKGIGKGIARVFASQGAKVLIVARDLAQAEAAAAEIRALIGGGEGVVSAVAADVSSAEDSAGMAHWSGMAESISSVATPAFFRPRGSER
jgi:3-oxoacyl-[acyl-carrier protein] reductase